MDPEASRARPGWLARKLPELFGIDGRSLALFRIGLGFLLLWDLFGRAQSLRAHYTAEGIFPREAALELRPDSQLFHVFLWSDRLDVQALLFGVFALLALLLLVGWHTRVVSVLTFVCLVSLVRRNPYVCHTGDTWLKALSFWAMFLPLGACCSIDRLRSRWRAPAAARALSIATAAALLQIAVFYVSAGYLKSRYDVWQRGDAVWVFTHAIEYTRPFGAWLGQHEGLCRFLTHATLVLEGLAPLLLFAPFWTPWVRCLLILAYAGFHLTLQLTIHIGIFQIICIVALSLYLPSAFWDGLSRRRSIARAGEALSTALVQRFARAEQHDPPPPRAFARLTHGSTQALAALAFVLVLLSNVNTARDDPYSTRDTQTIPIPGWIDAYARQMTLIQNWNMFTDIDRLFFGWFLVLGQREDGTIVDVLEQRDFAGLHRPEHYSALFPNHNTRRFWREIALPGREFLLRLTSEYLAREWLREHGTSLAHLAIFQIGKVPSRGASADEVKNLCLWESPRAGAKPAAPAERQRWLTLREDWRKFLATLPRTVPSSGSL